MLTAAAARGRCVNRGFSLLSSSMTDISATLRARLEAAIGAAHVLTAQADMAPYLADWRGRFHGAAAAVVRPQSTAEVAAVVGICVDTATPIVPRAATPDSAAARRRTAPATRWSFRWHA